MSTLDNNPHGNRLTNYIHSLRFFIRCDFVTSLSLIFLTTHHAAAETNKLKIGVISGLTGAAAKWSRFQNMGMELAKEELSRDGLDIELIFEDSSTSVPKALSAFYKLTDINKVDALVANDYSFVIAPLLPLAEKKGGVLIANSLSQEQHCRAAPSSFFSISTQIPLSRGAFERFFDLNPEVKRIATITFDDPEWGGVYRKIWETIANERGISIVDTFVSSDWQPDFKSILNRMISKNPDAILFAQEPEGIIKAAGQLQFKGKLLAVNNVLEMVAEHDAMRPELEGVFVVDPAIDVQFKEKFFTRFKKLPILEAYSGYEAVRSVVKASKENRNDLPAGMRKVRYEGAAGLVDFTAGSCIGNRGKWDLFRFDNGIQKRQ